MLGIIRIAWVRDRNNPYRWLVILPDSEVVYPFRSESEALAFFNKHRQ